MLQERGLKPGHPPEELNLKDPALVQGIHAEYLDSGADILSTNTFGANRIKLAEFGLGDRTVEINRKGVLLAREVAGGRALVAASISPLGALLEPMGQISLPRAEEAFKEQVTACARTGADLILIETMSDIQEAKVAVMAAKKVCHLPVVAMMTFGEDLRTMLGTDPESAAIVLEAAGADGVGANCSLGPDRILQVVERMARVTPLPLVARPNAGIPRVQDGRTVFPITPEEMAIFALRFLEAGVSILGGCCGTTPAHIRAIAPIVKGKPPKERSLTSSLRLASRTRSVFIGYGLPPLMVGERINPTGRKALSAELKEGKFFLLREEAVRQAGAGASLLDVNVGVPGADEPSLMAGAVRAIQEVVDLPLVLDSSNPEALEAGLKVVEGKALINSVSGEEKSLRSVLPLAMEYGAAVLGLCLDKRGLPRTAEERLQTARRILEEALKVGLSPQDLILDPLTLTVASEPEQAMETLRALRLIKEELGLPTILGVSNISFGLPNRSGLNAAFLSMALAHGLDLAIVNPYDLEIQEAFYSSRVLLNQDPKAEAYITWQSRIPKRPETGDLRQETKAMGHQLSAISQELTIRERLFKAVLEGDREVIIPLVEEALAEGMKPLEVSNHALIPALEEVGERFSRGVYFLPQVMLSAEVMKQAFERLKREMKQGEKGYRGRVLMATVEGDIHDIGKNIVATLLENHGFEVIDLGKSVPSDRIIEETRRLKVDLVGLSALMTTTMVRAEEVTQKMQEYGVSIPVMVGGAVMTKEFAERIGATYARDALEAVAKAKTLIQRRINERKYV